MLTAFPTPVLCIAADAVKDLEGRDALSGLWTLFTKCKESLQDGRRLENISWRLWYREMMRDDLKNRLYHEKEAQDQEHLLGLQETHAPNLYRPPTPSESESIPPPSYTVQDANGLNDSTLSYRPSLIPATTTVSPQDHHHPTSSPAFSSSSLNPTQDTMFRSISPVGSVPCPALESVSASLQMSKSKSDTVLSPVVPVQQYSLSVSSSGSKSPSGLADVTPQCAPPSQSTQRRRRSGFQDQIKCHAGNSVPAPVCVGRIIYDMLPCSASNASEGSRSWVRGLEVGLQLAGSSSTTTTTTRTLTAVESIPTPVLHPSSSLQPPALTPTMKTGYSCSTELTPTMNVGTPTHATIISSTTTTTTTTTMPSTSSLTTSNTRYTSLHTAPPSPSLSESYARAHPGEVKALDVVRLEVGVGLGPTLSVPASSSPQMLGNAHIFGLSHNSQRPPRVVVVNPTPNPTPHPTPPASPLLSASASSASTTSPGTRSNGMARKGDWLTLPPNHHPNRTQDQTQDRSRSEDLDSVSSTGAKAITATDIKSFSSAQLQPPMFSVQHQSAGEDQLLASSEQFVQDLETSAKSNSNRNSISSTTTNTSTTDSSISTVSTATTATSALLDEAYEEPRKTVDDDDRWLNNATVVAGPPEEALVDVSAQSMSKSNTGGNGSMRLGSLSTIESMSVRKSGQKEGESAVFTSDENTDIEEMGDGKGEGPSTRLMNTITTTGAAATKKIGTMKRSKTKTKPLKRNSLRSPTSTLSPPLPPPPLQALPPMTRRASSGRSSSRSASRSGRSGVGVGVSVPRNNGSVSRSRSRENRGIGGALLGMTAATRAASGERKKPGITVSTKPRNRPKFTLGRSGSKGSSSGKLMGGSGGGSAIVRRDSSGAEPGFAGAEGNGDDNEKEKERERAEMIKMQRRQQLLIQQQQQLEMKQRMEAEQRTLAVQLARQDAEAHEAEIRRQRQHHHQEQPQQPQEGTNGLLDVSSKRPVRFNIGSNSDECSGMGSKSGSEISGVERRPVADPIVNGKGKERDDRDAGVLEQEMRQPLQHGGFRQSQHHSHFQQHQQVPKQELHQSGMQQHHLQHQQRRQQHTAAPYPHHHHQHQQLKAEKQLERPVIPEGEQVQKLEKGKEREHSNPNTNSNLAPSNSKAHINNVHRPPPPAHHPSAKHSTGETLNMVSSALAAKVKHTLSDPLLPGQHKRMIVLTTSESEFEDSDDDGSWSSEEMGSEDDEEWQREEQQRQEQQLAHQQQQQQLQRQLQQQQQLQQQRLQQLQQRPPPVQRTHSTNQPPNANHNHNHNQNHTHTATRPQRTSRGHRHPSLHAHGQGPINNLTQVSDAQRQRDEMFAKKPTESFQNLTQVARTRSVGLLTQLMNPDPEIFPVGHPYRRGFSSSEIRGVGGGGGGDRARGFRPLQPLIDVKAMKADGPSHAQVTHRKSSSSASGGHSRATAALSPPARTLSMQMTKSTAAMPVSSQVQVGSVSANTSKAAGGGGHGVVNGYGMTNMKMVVNGGHSSGGYRPKGPPQDQELEDESGSEPESGGGIQVSKSVAQEKLKAWAERRGIVTHGNQPTNANGAAATGTNQKKQLGDEDDVPHWAKVSQPRQPTRTRSQDQYPQAPSHNANRRSLNGLHFSQMITSNSNHPTPIPVGHPYNLPPPAPPSTPRTTRRLMLSTELSESLRRNLLWERQVSKVNLAAVRRTASGGGSRHSVLGGIQPLTTAPNMVQLHPKGTVPQPDQESPMGTKQEGSGGDGVKERRASGGAIAADPGPSVHDEYEREERKKLAMARNRSWANDYHYAGW